MDADRWRQISRLYHAAGARAQTERCAFLDAACEGDEALRREVESLLADGMRAEAFLTAPALEAFDDLIASDPRAVPAITETGMVLGHYEIERVLGRGGMGVVLLAYDTTLHRQVALKVIDAPSDGDTSRTRILREARAAAALNHPNICTIHEVGDANGTAFIAMEFVEGRSLRDRLDEGALSLEETVRQGTQAADALAYAHEHGVVHRDFKAANVIASAGGRLKIVDFGLARRGDVLMASATTMPSLVPAGAAAGTPYAMAPEQVRGEAADARTDIWALGVLLYEMVTGARPYTGQTVPELFSSILAKAPATLPSTVPTRLRVVIERCLEKDPARRYQQARDVRAALEAIAAGRMAPWVAWGYHLRRRPILVPGAAFGAIVAVLVGFNVGSVRDRLVGIPPDQARIKLAVLPFQNLTGDTNQEYFSDGLTDEMITQLGRLHPQGLSVIARTSSMRYKNREMAIDQIGRELGVDYVLEGSVRREGSHVRIGATLLRVRDQTQRWAESFDRELAGMLTLQSDIARGVARSLALTLLPVEQARLAGARPVNPQAYEAYLQGLSYQSTLSPTNLDTALKYFELALERDPDYALAYAGIAGVWIGRQISGITQRTEAGPKLKAAIAKALALDDTIAEVHFRLAEQYGGTDWDWSNAEREYQRAIDLNPNHAATRALYADYLAVMRRPDEAIAQIERAVELDPLNSQTQAFYGRILMFARRYDQALVQFRVALKTRPDQAIALANLRVLFHVMGRYDEAFAAEQAWAPTAGLGGPAMAEALARGHEAAGYQGAMRRAADTLAARAASNGVGAPNVADYYLRAGETDRALDWLETAYEAHAPGLQYFNVSPLWDNLRDNPQVQILIRRMNLPR